MKRNYLIHWVGKFLVSCLVALGLIGCGVSTDESAPNDALTNIFDFSLTGNMTAVGLTQRIDLPVQFNNERASSLFHMSWDVESSDPYSIKAFISSNASISQGSDDQVFLDTQCGSDSAYICDSLGDQECALAYEPDYTYLVDLLGNRILDAEGSPIRLTNPDGSYIAVDHYVIRCNHGPATTDEAEITIRLQTGGFPATSLTNYIVFRACNGANSSCSAVLTTLEILDADPTD